MLSRSMTGFNYVCTARTSRGGGISDLVTRRRESLSDSRMRYVW